MRDLVVGLLLLAALPAAARETLPVNVQPIDVCASDGTSCALETSKRGVLDQLVTNTIFAQAGVTVNLLTPVRYAEPAGTDFLNPLLIDDPASGYSSGSPTDPAHVLLRDPGHMQNGDPRTLNVFFVNTLPHITTGTNTPGPVAGLGLLLSNGAIVATQTGNPDSTAHEIGHNLGLLHVDGTANDSVANLMKSLGRTVPSGVGDIAPSGPLDTLLAAQQDTLRAGQTALVGGELPHGVATFSPSRFGCNAHAIGCVITVQLPSAPRGAAITGVQVRYTSAIPILDDTGSIAVTSPCAINLRQPLGTTVSVPGGEERRYSFAVGGTPCLQVGDVASIIERSPSAADFWNFVPFSVGFTFSDGSTSSAAFFDASGTGVFTADSTRPYATGRVDAPPGGPGLPFPTDPAAFNAISELDPPGIPADDGVPVPEPPAAAVLALALFVLGLGRCRPFRRREAAPRRA